MAASNEKLFIDAIHRWQNFATDFHLKENQIKTQVVRPGPGQKAMEALGAKNWQAACTALWWN